MRTPGRCPNHDHCWLGNARRDVWVAVDEAFACPVCGTGLTPPPVQTLQAKGLARSAALGACALAAAATGGFAVVRGANLLLAPRMTASLHAPAKPAATRPVQFAAAKPVVSAARPQGVSTGAPGAQAAILPQPKPVEGLEATGESVAHLLLAQARLHPSAVQRSAAAPHLILPVSFGRPAAPDDESAITENAWHPRPRPARRTTGFLPGPGEVELTYASTAGTSPAGLGGEAGAGPNTELSANDLAPQAQGDDEDAPAAIAPAGVVQDAPIAGARMAANQLPSAVPIAAGLDRATGSQTLSDATPEPDAGAAAGHAAVPATVAALGAAVVGRIFGGDAAPSLPPARVDPEAAAQADTATNPLVKLVTLPPARAEQLPKPSYPPAYAELARPGQVSVNCTITLHGTPSGCAVLDERGGQHFADAVINWLQSGEVRYRPGIDAGRFVPAKLRYQVRFQPE